MIARSEDGVVRWRKPWLTIPLALFAVGFVANATGEAIGRMVSGYHTDWLQGFFVGTAVTFAYLWIRTHTTIHKPVEG